MEEKITDTGKFDYIQHPKKRVFLQAYSRYGNVTKAAEIAGVDRATHYEWIHSDEQYAEAFQQAQEAAADYLEQEAWRRATEGVEQDVFYKDKKIATKKEYSDTLLIFLLKGIRPEKYKERNATELTGPDGGPIKADISSEELTKLYQLIQEKEQK